MRKSLGWLAAGLLMVACSGSQDDAEKVDLKDFADRLSYALGADQARGFSDVNDPNFQKYDQAEIVLGFEDGLKDKNAYDQNCKSLLEKTFGNGEQGLADADMGAVSRCIGKLSGTFFFSGWEAKKALDKIRLDKVILGFKHGLAKVDTVVKREEQMEMIQQFIQDLNKINGEKMLAAAKSKPNTTTTRSGIVLETLQAGTGGSPSPADDVLAHYILMNSMGDTLQSSFDMVKIYKQPLTPFSLKAVVPGWQEGIPMMKKGGKYRLYLPYNLGYGAQGMYNPQTQNYDIQPYESLIFYIELLNFGPEGTLK